jgi:hypothetical protein
MAEEKAYRAHAVGTEQVLNAWRNMNEGYPYLAVFYTRGSKYFQYSKDDIEGAEAFLTTNLQMLEDQGDNSMYYLNIYDEAKKNYTNSYMVCAIPFRLNKISDSASVGALGSGSNSDLIKMLQEAHAKELALTKTIAAMQAENTPIDMWDRISGVLETPGVAAAMIPQLGAILTPFLGALTGVLTKISGVPPAQFRAPVQGIAGPPIMEGDLNEQIDIALDRLEKHTNIVELLNDLANFADKKPDMFKLYLPTLKSLGNE